MKKALFMASLLVCTLAHSQTSKNKSSQTSKFGIKGGINIASLTDFHESGFEKSPRTGINIGVYVRHHFNEKVAFQPELLYSAQGQVLKEDGSDLKMTYKLNYITIPLMIKYYPAPDFNLEFGPQLGFNVTRDVEVEFEGESETENIDQLFRYIGSDARTNTFDLALNFGLGYEFKSGLNFNGRYSLGMTKVFEGKDVTDDYGSPLSIKNRVFSVGIGYTFK